MGLTFDTCLPQAIQVAEISENILIAEIGHRLTSTYADISPDRVASAISRAHARFAQSPIRDFVPLLVERRARDELAGVGQLAASAQ